MKRLSPSILIAGLLTILVVLLLTRTLPTFGQGVSQTNALRTLSVQGHGFIDIPQTIAQVQLGVETQKDTAILAQTDIAKRSSAVVQFLQKNADVTKLNTAGVQLNPVYNTQSDQADITGYRGSNIVRFQIDPARIGNLLDQAVEAGASRIDGVSLIADDEAIAKATDTAIAQATEHAEQQALSALSALDLKQQEIIQIQINGANPLPTDLSKQLQQMTPIPVSPGASSIIAGEQRITATVTLQIRY